SGSSGACRRCAWLLVGILVALGITARLVCGAEGFEERLASHCMVEVWVPEMAKWVLLDPTLDTLFLVDHQAAGLYEVFDALRHHQSVTFDRRGSARLPAPSLAYYQRVLNHIFVARTNALFEG